MRHCYQPAHRSLSGRYLISRVLFHWPSAHWNYSWSAVSMLPRLTMEYDKVSFSRSYPKYQDLCVCFHQAQDLYPGCSEAVCQFGKACACGSEDAVSIPSYNSRMKYVLGEISKNGRRCPASYLHINSRLPAFNIHAIGWPSGQIRLPIHQIMLTSVVLEFKSWNNWSWVYKYYCLFYVIWYIIISQVMNARFIEQYFAAIYYFIRSAWPFHPRRYNVEPLIVIFEPEQVYALIVIIYQVIRFNSNITSRFWRVVCSFPPYPCNWHMHVSDWWSCPLRDRFSQYSQVTIRDPPGNRTLFVEETNSFCLMETVLTSSFPTRQLIPSSLRS